MSLFENWIFLGLGAAVFFGLSSVLAKIVVGEKFFGIDPKTAGILTVIGIALVLGAYFFSSPTSIPKNPVHIGLGIGVGILWGLGNLFVLIAFQNKANIAQLAPIYNINTLIAVVLGIFLLAEIPSQTQTIKILVGAILITVGAVLVSG